MEDYLLTENLEVGYQGKALLREIQIRLKKGQIMTLIGPNGAGKSTILKSISRQLAPIGGTIYFNSQNMNQITDKELATKMALVLTEHVKTDLMTCRDVVSSGRYPYTGRFGILTKKDWEIVENSMELVQISELANKDFLQISDGQKQRVMLARAICQEPEILVLDEPTSFLDVKYKLEFLYTLQKMTAQKKMAVLMSLHELDFAQRISDQILCVDGQRVVRIGTPDEVFTSGFVKELYHIEKGFFDEESGRIELPKSEGEPEVFLIAGGGTGIPVYRTLQRKKIPFSTGILGENDRDYPVAENLAVKVIFEKAFEPISEDSIEKAKEEIRKTKKTICCLDHFGPGNQENRQLMEYAKEKGKLEWRK